MRKNHKPEGRVPKWVVAQAYAPEQKVACARVKLNRWIHQCTPLLKALKRAGYSENAKKFSIREIALIYRYLGEPKDDEISRIETFLELHNHN